MNVYFITTNDVEGMYGGGRASKRNLECLKENFDIFDFQLSETEMAQVSSLDEDYKYHLESASCPGY